MGAITYALPLLNVTSATKPTFSTSVLPLTGKASSVSTALLGQQEFTSPHQVPEGLAKSDWQSIRSAYEAGRHQFFKQEDGSHVARNPGMGWKMTFDEHGFTAQPEDGAWTWGLELSSSGTRSSDDVRLRVPLEATANRLSRQLTPAITEWFVNDQRGLEQGWTLTAPAEIRLRFRGNLKPSISPQSISFGGQLTYSGLKAWDATGKTIPTHFEATAEGFAVRYDDSAAQYPLTIDPIAQQAYVKASNTGSFDRFGSSVAISGDTVVIGATGEASNANGVNGNQANNIAESSGAAYVFTRSGSTWTQQAYLKASNTGTYDNFGSSVALSGDTAVIGATGEDSNATGVGGNQANNSAFQSGAAYVFTRSGSTWTQQAYLKASNAEADDNFGSSVAVSGDTVVIGADSEDSNATGVNGNQANNNATLSGAAYVFTRSGSTWTQQAYLKASNTGAYDYFGLSVAVAGDTAVIGAYGEDSNAAGVGGNQADNSAADAGAAYVFTRSGSTWTQQAYLKASNSAVNDYFGRSVAVSGDTAVIGAYGEDSNATGVGGNGGSNSATFSGAAYMFTRSGSTWAQQAYLKASNTGANDYFGRSVALSGDTAIIGAYLEDSGATGVDGNQDDNIFNAGAAYVFTRSGTTWTQQAYLKASNTEADDYFGFSVAVSGDTAVIGAYQEDSNATGVGGNQANNSADTSGAAYIFTGLVPPPVPTITSISPAAGSTFGSTALTITGTNFTGATGVSIGGAAAAGVVVINPTTIACTTPSGIAGPASVVVTIPGGSNAANSLFTYYVPITPDSGTLAGGTSVTIQGSGFTGATAVTFGGIHTAAFSIINDTTISATTPARSAGMVNVIVTAAGGSPIAEIPFTYFDPIVTATYTSADDVPITAAGYMAAGKTVNLTLSFAPATGTALTVVKNTGRVYIDGTFSNLAQGQTVTLSHDGLNFQFVANYYGGTGNDLVLHWAGTRVMSWGSGSFGQLGNNKNIDSREPTDVMTRGVLFGKTIANVSSGSNHTIALCSDGTLAAWGDNTWGQLGDLSAPIYLAVPAAVTTAGTPIEGKTITAVSAGGVHNLVLCSDGMLAAWGNNGTTNSRVPAAVTTTGTPLAGKTVIAIAAGDSHSLVLCSDGTLAAMGDNTNGQLGDNTTSSSQVPVAVTTAGTPLAGKTVTAIAAGGSHNLVLCSDGTLAAWGYGGTLGNNSTVDSLVPVAVTTAGTPLAGKTVTAITAGGGFSLALCSDGTLAAWGDNTWGQLGNNSTANSLVPAVVPTAGTPLSGKTVTAISAGGAHTLALCSDGTLVVWGFRGHPFPGADSSYLNSLVPVSVATSGTPLAAKTVSSVNAGDYHSLALCTDGTLAAWGDNYYGELGNNSNKHSIVPVAVLVEPPLSGKTVIAVDAGYNHTLALCSDGTLSSWGINDSGQLGNNDNRDRLVPVAVTTASTPLAGKTVVAIAAGASHNLTLCSDGTLASWGSNYYGQLGNNSLTDSSLPTAVTTVGTPLAGKSVIAIAAGYFHNLALCSDGSLAAWGRNTEGQLGNNSASSSLVPVAVTTAGTPIAGKTVVAIAVGQTHSLVLCSDGTLAAWGLNSSGQLGNNSTVASWVPVLVTTAGTPLAGRTVTAIAAEVAHNLVLCSDGTLVAWGGGGMGGHGILGNNTGGGSLLPIPVITDGTLLAGKAIVSMAPGNYHNLALCSDGTLAAWGSNGGYQLGLGNNAAEYSLVPVAVSTTTLMEGERFVGTPLSVGSYHSLALVAAPIAPDIAVTHAVPLTDDGNVVFGSSAPKTFTITNPGNAPLTSLAVTKDGADAGDFIVSALSGTSIPVGAGTVTFTVTFSPTTGGTKTAAIHIASNVIGAKNPLDITLTGTGPSSTQAVYNALAAAGLTGPNATLDATPYQDGVANLLKYAFNMNLSGPDSATMPPNGASGLPGITAQPNGGASVFRFEFLRRKNSGLIYTPQKSGVLANPASWVPLTDTPTIISIDATWERVIYEEPYNAATTPMNFGRVQVTIP
jgi:alpha-tubulin suppressor-like RCC1 family protein